MKALVRYSRRQRPMLCSALLTLAFSVTALGQAEPMVKIDAGNGGHNTLQGDVITPNGQRLDHPVLVRLSTPRGEITTTSNGNGSFVFRSLTAGRYTVVIDSAEGYAAAIEQVDINESSSGNMSRMGEIYTVQVHLRPASGPPVTKGVISANDPPKAALDLYNKALTSVKDGNRDKAIEQLKAAIAIQPTFVAALNGLGVQYMKMGNYKEAYEAFNSALKITSDSFILHLNCGITLFSLNKYAEAEAEFTSALMKNGTSGTAYIYRARSVIALNRLDDAVKDLKRAIEIGGDDVKIAHRFLGGIYVEKGEAAEAVKELELYLKASPTTKESEQIKNLIKELNKKAGSE
jgi:tetratricopeptide (TPR) repeat protein